MEICLKDKELRGCLDICLLCVSVGLQKDWVNHHMGRIRVDKNVCIKELKWAQLFKISHRSLCLCECAHMYTIHLYCVHCCFWTLSMALSLVSMLKPIKKAEYQSSELQRPYYF